MKLRALVRQPAARVVLLTATWLASYAIYYLFLVRPYWLTTYLATPRLSTGVIANRQAGPAAAFIGGFVVLFALYAAAYRLCRGWRAATPAVIAICLCGLVLALLLVPVYPIGANDLFGYITAGELLAFHDVNPMVHPATFVPNLPFAEYSAYAHILPNYGPVWTWIEGLVAWAVGKPDLLALTLGFKAVAVLAYATALILLALVLRRRAPDRLAAGLIVLAWNPLVLFEVAVNAHNDIWIGLFLLAGVLLWDARRPVGALVALALAALVKIPVAPLVPLFFVAAFRQEPVGPRRARFAWMAVAAVVALVAASYLSLPEGLKGVLNLESRSELFTDSLPAVARLALSLTIPQTPATLVVAMVTLLAFGSYVLWQIVNVWRAPGQVVRLAFNVLLFLLLLCMSWFQPWYLLWIIPLAAVFPRPNAPFQVGLFGLCATWSYVVFGFIWFWLPKAAAWGRLLGIELMALVSTYGLSWEYAILSGVPRRAPTVPGRTP